MKASYRNLAFYAAIQDCWMNSSKIWPSSRDKDCYPWQIITNLWQSRFWCCICLKYPPPGCLSVLPQKERNIPLTVNILPLTQYPRALWDLHMRMLTRVHKTYIISSGDWWPLAMHPQHLKLLAQPLLQTLSGLEYFPQSSAFTQRISRSNSLACWQHAVMRP